jgi:homoserine O-succinyltransferase/O-acetyltransferase
MPSPTHRASPRRITVALVNNMPDAAFVDTERQFQRAVSSAPGAEEVEIPLYTMPGIARTDAVAGEIRSRYLGLDDLWDTRPDALIVTGTEPVQSQLQYEPYWPSLSQLLQWAAEEVSTTLLSCLAAHASLLLFDGITREPLPSKCCGVFDGVVETRGPLAVGLPDTVAVPHSRVNDISEAALIQAGYSIVVGRAESLPGWSVACRAQGAGMFVLCQGHPEYSVESLLREYRRDVRRALFGRGAVPYPSMPDGYFTPESSARLADFAARATEESAADPVALYESFPYEEVRSTLTNRWADSSATFYLNWLASVGGATGSVAGATSSA